MKTTLRALALTATLAGLATPAQAYPFLQLDIIGGYYDAATQTIISSSHDFVLIAALQPASPGPLTTETFYISAAVHPPFGPGGGSLGSFTWDGTPYNVTSDLVYGTPPLEPFLDADPGDFPDHAPGVFPTYFTEFAFQFNAAQRHIQYDSAVTPGGLVTSGTGDGYYVAFNVTTAMFGDSVLHFDLYDTSVRLCGISPNPNCINDIDLRSTAAAADPKHDAQSSNVPEPASALLIGLGAVGALRSVRRRRVQA
jgi:hypothetical protein